MPPRSRKTAQPDTDEDAATATTEASAEAQDSDDLGAPGDKKPAPEGDKKPERSDLQKADQPCPECMPNGWPEGAFSVGCTHGTWVRDSA